MDVRKTKITTLLVLLTVLTLGWTNRADAQARMGVKGGLNVSNLYVDDVDDENARFGFNVGVYGQIFSNDVFALQPELLFSTKGSKNEFKNAFFGIDQTVKFNLNYIDLPVLAVIKLGESAEIHVGPYASYLVNANVDYSGNINANDELDKDDFSAFDFGLTGGIGFNFGAMQVGARYNYGLVKVADSNGGEALLGDAKNSNAQLYLAFNFAQD
ncbi:MAG: porin family protein [Chryseolinea sp.]